MTSVDDELAGLRSELEMRSRDLEVARQELRALRSSLSWRLTAPLREAKTALRRAARKTIDSQQPEAVRANQRLLESAQFDPFVPLLDSPQSVPRSKVRTVAFYLPQFHPIPENDEWWGRGFTEWTNVVRAHALFDGHYQPRLPGELGFYDLRVPDVQKRQVELAKLYGIDAFCFYTYWFEGRRLLERPVEQYLAHPELDLPFCLCWANENWTRRWDGSDSTVLIAHRSSPEDDLAFIEYVSRYLVDSRYVRIDGRPLLLIYRPGILPDARATAERWRGWLREHHGLEVVLAYVQGRTDADPAAFGFDAAVEFPPVPPPGRPPPRELTHTLAPRSPDVRARVYDWQDIAAESMRYATPPFRLFRGVCPSWDNTARRGSAATVLWNSTPAAFQNWLLRALEDTATRLPAEEQLVFVNAWNEWAEGCYLEPDRRYGYAYLEALRVALVRAHARRGVRAAVPRLGVLVHAFHPDLVPDLLDRLEAVSSSVGAVLVSTSEGARAEVERIVRDRQLPAELVTVANHGRDILPFLQCIPRLEERGVDIVVKLHTKRSEHLDNGAQWREELLSELLEPSTAARVVRAFERDPSIGIVGPTGHRLALSSYIGSNAASVAALAHRLGIEEITGDHSFFAGSMFYVRLAALASLRAIQLGPDDFEPELGQVDGTVAHAVERCFSIAVEASGFCVRDTASLNEPLETSGLTSGYRYADAPAEVA